ncbi:hypothetical protein [Tahibacter soli]|uniref:Uncharacterized protein n=1 Tax=Tahibacter soli TaxID=2983605 RepID=A0A9X4BJU2_9GAMM|nr:hypothetical protein [Tahibacter soli]MDC8015043.1 hypothetical protein [Tahibacter soli]
MRLIDAIKLIELELPENLRGAMLSCDPRAIEIEGDGYSFWQEKDVNKARWIITKRLRVAEAAGGDIVNWLSRQLEVLDHAKDEVAIYRGYTVSKGGRKEFIVAPVRRLWGVYVKSVE